MLQFSNNGFLCCAETPTELSIRCISSDHKMPDLMLYVKLSMQTPLINKEMSIVIHYLFGGTPSGEGVALSNAVH